MRIPRPAPSRWPTTPAGPRLRHVGARRIRARSSMQSTRLRRRGGWAGPRSEGPADVLLVGIARHGRQHFKPDAFWAQCFQGPMPSGPVASNPGQSIAQGDMAQIGGPGRNRTGIRGFAVRCITTLPPDPDGSARYIGAELGPVKSDITTTHPACHNSAIHACAARMAPACVALYGPADPTKGIGYAPPCDVVAACLCHDLRCSHAGSPGG